MAAGVAESRKSIERKRRDPPPPPHATLFGRLSSSTAGLATLIAVDSAHTRLQICGVIWYLSPLFSLLLSPSLLSFFWLWWLFSPFSLSESWGFYFLTCSLGRTNRRSFAGDFHRLHDHVSLFFVYTWINANSQVVSRLPKEVVNKKEGNKKTFLSLWFAAAVCFVLLEKSTFD